MSAWFHLVKKELRLGLTAFLLPVIAFIVFSGIVAYFGQRAGIGWDLLFGLSIIATGVQTFYLAYYMFYSLQSERKKLHLWLHNPLPSYSLLLAKGCAGFLYMFITLIVTGTTLLVGLSQSEGINESFLPSTLVQLTLFGGLHLVLFSLYIGIVFVFFWIIFLWFTRQMNSFLSFVSTFILSLISTFIYSRFENSSFYETLTMWGEIPMNDFITRLGFTTNITGTTVETEMEQLSIFLGFYVVEGIIAILLFLVACWILDKKVEV